tara:strand:+ start:297 stop:587 length:291 start_codon:yes stop_codon:yes gene_type:complete
MNWSYNYGITMDKKPKTPIEHKIKLLLGLSGYEHKDTGFNRFKTNEGYFFTDGFIPIDDKVLKYVEIHSKIKIDKQCWVDEAFGEQCFYQIDSEID